jgi:hypothetical protein
LPEVKTETSEDKSAAFTLIFSRFTERNGVLILVLGVVATVVSIIGVRQLEVENRFIDYFHSSTEIHQGMLVIDQQLGGTITLDIILDHHAATVISTSAVDPFAADADIFGASSEFASDDPFGSDADPFASSEVSEEAIETQARDVYASYWFTQAGLEKITQLHQYLDRLPDVGKVQSLATA